MVRDTPVIVFREGIHAFLRKLSRQPYNFFMIIESCKENKIPLLVFSAGLGDIIREIMLQANLFSSNMHIVSNMMIFDEENVCVGFKDPLVHVFNKNEANVKGTPYYETICKKRVNSI